MPEPRPTAYHAGVPHGLYPTGFHAGAADDCDDTACHGQPPRTDPAADLERMAFDLAIGCGIVVPAAITAAIAALAEAKTAEGRMAAAEWLRTEYTGPGADVAIRRAADRITLTAAPIAVEAHPPLHRWRVETLDSVADQWTPMGSLRSDSKSAHKARAAFDTSHPLWADGEPAQRRVVRETTTYTVEPEQP